MSIRVDSRAAIDGLDQAERQVSPAGLAELARPFAEALDRGAARAFASKVDPATGAAWPEAADATRKSRLFKSLLVRSGALERAVIAGVRTTDRAAFAQLGIETPERSVLVRGLVHFYGVTRRARRSNRTARVRPKQTLSARRFAGLSSREISEFIDSAEAALAGERS